jgi:2-oxoglutarate dehydrogenase E2 component (dihydrolipoamide succinyltransferase)
VTTSDLQSAIVTASSELVGEEPPLTAVRGNEHRASAASIVEADVTDLTSLCRSARWNGVEAAFIAHVLHAATAEMQAHASLNSHAPDGGSPNNRAQVNVGIQLRTPRGLAVRVVRDASDLNVQGIARRLDELAKAAHTEILSSPLLAGATFTVADAGSRALLADIPLLSPGQLAALTVGAVVERPAVVRDRAGAAAIAVRSAVFHTLSYHPGRVGAEEAAQFLSGVKERLQHPLQAVP